MFRTQALVSLVLASPAMLLSGCATLGGAPEAPFPLDDRIAQAGLYPKHVALTNISTSNIGGMTPKDYRDKVIWVHIDAVDAKYEEFSKAISREDRELGLGFDLSILGLTNGAAFVKDSVAKDLSAAAAIFAGSKAIVEKNVYFDKALPALKAAMDTERLKVKTRIVANMKRSVLDYPLSSAFFDIGDYHRAATLDRAIELVTAKSQEERQDAQDEYDVTKALPTCESVEDVAAQRAKLRALLTGENGEETSERHRTIAKLMGVNHEQTNIKIKRDMFTALSTKYCTISEIDDLLTQAEEKVKALAEEDV